MKKELSEYKAKLQEAELKLKHMEGRIESLKNRIKELEESNKVTCFPCIRKQQTFYYKSKYSTSSICGKCKTRPHVIINRNLS